MDVWRQRRSVPSIPPKRLKDHCLFSGDDETGKSTGQKNLPLERPSYFMGWNVVEAIACKRLEGYQFGQDIEVDFCGVTG